MSVFHRILAVVLALAFLAAGIITIVEIVGAAVGHHGHVLLAYERPSRWLHGQPWTAHWVIAGLIVAGVIGLLLLITGLKPRKAGLLVMHSDLEGVTLAVPRRSLARAVSRVAGDVDGVSGARTEISSRQARVRTVTHLRDTAGLTQNVQSAVAGFLDGLGLERTPAVRVSLEQEER